MNNIIIEKFVDFLTFSTLLVENVNALGLASISGMFETTCRGVFEEFAKIKISTTY